MGICMYAYAKSQNIKRVINIAVSDNNQNKIRALTFPDNILPGSWQSVPDVSISFVSLISLLITGKIYTTKRVASLYGNLYVRLCVSSCFEVWSWNLAWGRGRPHEIWEHNYFQSDPINGQRSPEGKLFKKCPWPPHIVGRIPDRSVMHWWGQKTCKGQRGSSRGQIVQ